MTKLNNKITQTKMKTENAKNYFKILTKSIINQQY